jgi:hypothetical protein
MIRRLILKLALFLKPLRAGDVLYGDPVWWVIPRPIEMVLHGLKDIHGANMYTPIPSEGCYKLTIDKDLESYYILDSEVLCNTKFSSIVFWKKRSQPRRMARLQLEEYFLNGMLWRE